MTRRPVRVQLRLWHSPDKPSRLSVVIYTGGGAVPLTAAEAFQAANALVDAAERLTEQEAGSGAEA